MTIVRRCVVCRCVVAGVVASVVLGFVLGFVLSAAVDAWIVVELGMLPKPDPPSITYQIKSRSM